MPFPTISWRSVLAVIGFVAVITGIAVNVKNLGPLFSRVDPLSKELEYLRESEPLRIPKGKPYFVDEPNLSFSEIVLEDGAELLLSPELEIVAMYSRKLTIGSGVKIIGKGKDQPVGQSGSSGSHGARCSTGGQGSNGKHGSDGGAGVNVDIRSLDICFLGSALKIDISGGRGGDGGNGGAGGKGGQASLNRNCPGGNGGRGGDGGNGGAGGKGGSVSITYNNARFNEDAIGRTQFERTYINFRSVGGDPGAPGTVGQGGIRGDGKESDIFGSLDSEPGGNPGAAGRAGSRGAKGKSGSLKVTASKD